MPDDLDVAGPLDGRQLAAYERGRADRQREFAEERAAALLAEADQSGAAAPYEPSQIQIDVASAGVDELRAEVGRLDNRLRWALRHHDDAVTTHWFALAKLGDDRRELYERGLKRGLQASRRAMVTTPATGWGKLRDFALDATEARRPARLDWHVAVMDALLDLDDAFDAAECGSSADAAMHLRVAFGSLAGIWLDEDEADEVQAER